MIEDYTALRSLLTATSKNNVINSTATQNHHAEESGLLRSSNGSSDIKEKEFLSPISLVIVDTAAKIRNTHSTHTNIMHASKKKAAFEQWHKRKLSEIEQKCSTVNRSIESNVEQHIAANLKRVCSLPVASSAKNEVTVIAQQQQRSSLILQLINKPLVNLVASPQEKANLLASQAEANSVESHERASLAASQERASSVASKEKANLLASQVKSAADSVKKKLQPIAPTSSNAKSNSNTTFWTKNSCKTTSSEDLITPKLSRHNDAAFYPNIQCILCKEWVCSRNRYMHIESHLQYRPYRCEICNYDNRKKIFIELHINRVHRGAGNIVYNPDTELEKRAWAMAEQCLQHTREVLLACSNQFVTTKNGGKEKEADESNQDSSIIKGENLDEERTRNGKASTAIVAAVNNTTTTNNTTNFSQPFLSAYEDVFRPNIYNNQRRGKSLLIEQSRQLGLIPDFSEVLSREECCRLCRSYILRNHSLLEEHVRGHLSEPSYACTFSDCRVVHNSKNFIYRHMKEVHRARQPVKDGLEDQQALQQEFLALCQKSFPDYYSKNSTMTTSTVGRRQTKAAITNEESSLNNGHEADSSTNCAEKPQSTTATPADTTCFGCEIGFMLFYDAKSILLDTDRQCCLECMSHLERLNHSNPGGNHLTTNAAGRHVTSIAAAGRLICRLCSKFVRGDSTAVQWHSLEHFIAGGGASAAAPFSCALCPFDSCSTSNVKKHLVKHHQMSTEYLNEKRLIRFNWNESSHDWRSMWMQTCRLCFEWDDGGDQSASTLANYQVTLLANLNGCLNKFQPMTAADLQFYSTCCTLCLSLVIGDYRTLYEHSRKHMSRCTHSCPYCPCRSESEREIADHVTRSHPGHLILICSDASQECVDERNLLLSLCFPDIPPLQWANDDGESIAKSATIATTVDQRLICKLCKESVQMQSIDNNSNNRSSSAASNIRLSHVERRHVTERLFRCHACQFLHTNQNRVLDHARQTHNADSSVLSSSSSSLLLPKEIDLGQETFLKLAILMNLCFD